MAQEVGINAVCLISAAGIGLAITRQRLVGALFQPVGHLNKALNRGLASVICKGVAALLCNLLCALSVAADVGEKGIGRFAGLELEARHSTVSAIL